MSATILVVDDMDFNRELTARLLKIHDYGILFAINGKEAIEKSRNELPDIILMDIGLPDIDGWQVTKILKSDDSTRNIPIIALTAHDTQAYRDKAEETGCDGFISKPIDIKLLIEQIKKTLARVNSKSEQAQSR